MTFRNDATLLATLLGGLIALSACRTTQSTQRPPASGGSSSTTDAEGREAHAGDRPAGEGHRFAPRQHVPHVAPRGSEVPVLASLPPFVDGSQRCFPEDYYRPTPPPPPYYPTRPREPWEYMSGPTVGGSAPKSSSSSSSNGYGTGRGSSNDALAESKAEPAKKGEGSASRSKPSPAPAATPAAESAAPAGPRYQTPTDDRRDIARRRSESDEEAPLYRAPDPAWGAAIYLSNDDTMSLSSAQRVIWAIDHYAPLPAAHVRPHELLNYFSFHTAPVEPDHDFSVVANIAPSADDPSLATLALAVRGRALTKTTRRSANLSYAIDRSGSMADEGRMNYLKQGLVRSLDELKHGDIVNITLFDSTSCQLAQNFVVGRDDISRLRRLIDRVQPRGSTNLYDGLVRAYEQADRVYQPTYTNRVILVTDALANTGVTDEQLIATVGKHYDARRIRLSGIGVGSEFNDSLLDQLTERGRGAYVFLGSPAEVDAVFGPRFVSLIETVAGDVHFRLHLPPSLAMQTFHGEEASIDKERVQAIHYFANTSQLFLSDLRTQGGRIPRWDDLMLSIEYEDPETGAKRVEEFAWNLGNIEGAAPNLDKALLVNRFSRGLAQLAEREPPVNYRMERYGWNDGGGYQLCQATTSELSRLSTHIAGDPEVGRVRQLWDSFCSRYQAQVYREPYPTPAPAKRNNDFAPPDTWPSAGTRPG